MTATLLASHLIAQPALPGTLRRSVPMRRTNRRGAVAVEAAIVLGLLFMLLFVIFDLGLAAARYNMLSGTARSIARQAIVRGAKASTELSPWGPGEYAGNAADSAEMARIAAPLLATMDPADVVLEVSWPDGDNEVGNRVHVHLSFVHRPFVPLLNLAGSFTLRADSTMRIMH